jgi:sugar phosphate permease
MDSKELNDGSSVVPPAEIRPRYSVFTKREKWCISGLVSYAAFFSTLSSFIYYPAIPSMSESLSVSIKQINWTVTSYMAVATIGPTLIGDAADLHGRRPVYIIVLSLYIVTCVAIAAAKSYPALVGLRVVQALAISGGFQPHGEGNTTWLIRLRSHNRHCVPRRTRLICEHSIICVSRGTMICRIVQD